MNKTEEKKPKEYSLTNEEHASLMWRVRESGMHVFYQKLIDNNIVDFIKTTVYARLKLDPNREYSLSEDGKKIFIEEANEQTMPKVQKT